MEKEVSGLYLSGHPLDAYREQSAKIASHSIKMLTGRTPISWTIPKSGLSARW